jgi:sterol desaturase/sphingolipid hydroxylase (fatty acid hydroxylase superfamily)
MNGFTLLTTAFVLSIFLVITLESYIAKKRNLKLYTISDSVINLSCGILERIFDFFYSVLFLAASSYIYDNVAFYQIPSNIFTGFIGLLIFDLLAYWHHRLSHEVNFLWAAHIVHHQSEELNLTTVFRVSFFAVINRSAFFICMPLIGFGPFTILILGLILGLYQLFTHSRLIGKLGVFELFMTTPSHHRVHHGREEKYMDHNYGHIFIIWDKVFGTYTPEEEEPTYGITTGFESANPYTAQFSYWKDLITRSRRANGILDKIKIFFKAPTWTPKDVGFLANAYKTDKNGNRLSQKGEIKPESGIYILINALFTFSIFIGLVIGIGNKGVTLIQLLRNPHILTLCIIILLSVYAHGKMFEQTKAAIWIDASRLVITGICITTMFSQFSISYWLIPTVLSWCGIMLIWLLKIAIQLKPVNL